MIGRIMTGNGWKVWIFLGWYFFCRLTSKGMHYGIHEFIHASFQKFQKYVNMETIQESLQFKWVGPLPL